MRIGLSILTVEGHNIWNNGIGQNIYHLACLLKSIPFVEQVVLLNTGDQNSPPGNSGEIGQRFPLLPLREGAELIDVAIEISGGLDPEWIGGFRARGGKVVYHICGQPYHGLVEPTLFGKPGYFSQADRCDEVWLLPKDQQFTAMIRSLHRCPVHVVPYLWSSVFLEQTIGAISVENLSFGYQPGTLTSGPAIPAIFEPNLSPIKMGIIPFMICETINAEDPSRIGHVHFMNSAHMAGQNSFIFLMTRASLYQNQKVSLAARDYFARVMGQGANMVLSHQICCSQNYLYLDAIFGNYPLIHNSHDFSNIGYYYPDSDIEAGREQFLLACREHDHNLVSYAANSAAAIAALSPSHRDNQTAYARQLLQLMHHGQAGRAA